MKESIATSFAAFLITTTGIYGAQSAYVGGQPSIDCTAARNSVAQILCSGPRAAQADWELNSALWALYFSVDEARRAKLDLDQQAWRESLERRCALPQVTQDERAGQFVAQAMGRMSFGPPLSMPSPQPLSQANVNCIISAYRARAGALRSHLSGDALAESLLTANQHVELQEALFQKGFLRSDLAGSSPSDGEFGPVTRQAIRQFQQSLGATPSGFLSSDQRTALLERPEAKAARLAAEAKARKEALDAQAAADAAATARANAEAARLAAEAKARKEALDAQAAADAAATARANAEAARLAAEAKARKEALDAQAAADAAATAKAIADAKAREDAENARLEAETEQAKQWRMKVDEARIKGMKYAEAADSKWSLSEVDNPMIDDKDYTVTSVQLNGKGAVANIEGTCRRPGQVSFVATLGEIEEPNSPLGLPDFAPGYVAGNERINDDPAFPTRFQTRKFRNTILLATLTSQHTADSIETTWRVLAEVETARGRIIMQIPTFNHACPVKREGCAE
jgi:peptidoglycan hydrolase-like protein with peptidoglycan-binding domain